MNVLRLVLALGAIALLAGCAPSYTNLTPRNAVRTTTDVYRFEVQWDTSRRGANNPDVKAYVAIGPNLYPMRRVTGTPDRWEADVPVPRGEPLVSYRYKFDYTYPSLTQRVSKSDYSPAYFLDMSKPVTGFSTPTN